jgi:alkylation response protein AidB-like acyl-CoA dehydrogenase
MSLNKRNLEFLLYELFDLTSLTSRARFHDHDKSVFDDVLNMSLELARKEFAPHNRKNDLFEPHLENGVIKIIPEVKQALDKLREAGFFAAHASFEDGGMQLPNLLWNACQAAFIAANCGTTGYAFLTVGAGNLISSFGTLAQKEKYWQKMLSGQWFGTMCLSEPHAGSSLADIYSKATPHEDGTYRIKGSKMWISAGDHDLAENIVHLVLAKLPDAPAGVKGISLFIVPKFRLEQGQLVPNDVNLAGLNHKMGYRGTTNALLSLGEADDCHAELVGQAHHGLPYMFQMMNEARIGVGMAGAALACAGFEYSLGYALERRQGRHAGSKDPNAVQVRIIEHTDVRRMLLAQKSLAEGALSLCLYASLLVDEHQTNPDEMLRKEAHTLLELLTPIVKAWSTHYGLEANYHAIQILGGYGYTREYPVEQIYRDNRLNPIHEGTNGIQAIDLLGRKIPMLDGAGLKLLSDRVRQTIVQARVVNLFELADALSHALDVVQQTTFALMSAKHSPELRLANAWHYLEMLGHTVVAWLWLRQAVVAQEALLNRTPTRDTEFYNGKLQAAKYFFKYELPKVALWSNLLSSFDNTTLEMNENWF